MITKLREDQKLEITLGSKTYVVPSEDVAKVMDLTIENLDNKERLHKELKAYDLSPTQTHT